jgi:drug/metabolite transporter (DMT)-like permease
LFKRKDIQLRFLALFLTGIEAVILKKIILISSVEVCFIFWCFMGLLWSLFFVVTSKRNIKLENKNILIYLILIAIMLGLMQYSTNYVFKRVNVGYSLALFQLSSIVTVLLGCKFFDEKSLYKKLLGSFIMILGSCLIILL